MSLDHINHNKTNPGVVEQTTEAPDATPREQVARAQSKRTKKKNLSTIEEQLKELEYKKRELLREKVKEKRKREAADKMALGTMLQDAIMACVMPRNTKSELLGAVAAAARAEREEFLDRLFDEAETLAMKALGVDAKTVTDPEHREAFVKLHGRLHMRDIGHGEDLFRFLVFLVTDVSDRPVLPVGAAKIVRNALGTAEGCLALARQVQAFPPERVARWLRRPKGKA